MSSKRQKKQKPKVTQAFDEDDEGEPTVEVPVKNSTGKRKPKVGVKKKGAPKPIVTKTDQTTEDNPTMDEPTPEVLQSEIMDSEITEVVQSETTVPTISPATFERSKRTVITGTHVKGTGLIPFMFFVAPH